MGRWIAPAIAFTVTYCAAMSCDAVCVSVSATIMSPLGVISILLIYQLEVKLLISVRRCSTSSPQLSLVSPCPVKYAEAYSVTKLSGVMSYSAIAYRRISLLECLYRCIIAL